MSYSIVSRSRAKEKRFLMIEQIQIKNKERWQEASKILVTIKDY